MGVFRDGRYRARTWLILLPTGSASERERIENIRAADAGRLSKYPEGEREEIRQIFIRKGFASEVLAKIVETITANRLWVETIDRSDQRLNFATATYSDGFRNIAHRTTRQTGRVLENEDLLQVGATGLATGLIPAK